jgi:hypothetical protein
MQSYQIIIYVKCINLASFKFLRKLGCYKHCDISGTTAVLTVGH